MVERAGLCYQDHMERKGNASSWESRRSALDNPVTLRYDDQDGPARPKYRRRRSTMLHAMPAEANWSDSRVLKSTAAHVDWQMSGCIGKYWITRGAEAHTYQILGADKSIEIMFAYYHHLWQSL